VRPCIGISAYWRVASFGAWSAMPVAIVPQGYVVAIQEAGGAALLVPPDPAYAGDADVLDALDGLVVVGGEDVEPSHYGAEAEPGTDVPNILRDSSELALLRGALARDLPVLGICRGMQVMNVARGGTLRQHLPDEVGHEDHRRTPGSFDGADHDVRLADASLAARAAGEVDHATKSHHHQGIAALGDGFVETGWSTLDELPEAIEDPQRRFALGVQWHPEADPTSRLIAALVGEAAGRPASASGAAP
jgi:putative glutamine amidotransferase